MDESDSVLIQRLTAQGDADAFSTIVRQYADMVYSTSRRVLGNDAQAADVAQETFFQFLKSADRITGSVGAWLHRVATRRAVDLVRQEASRRHREESYASGGLHEVEQWSEIEPLVDEALEELPEESRALLVLHYLKGRSMTEIAEEQGSSQPTISRRVATALEQLREKLRARDVLVGVAILGPMLANSTQAASVAVLDSLGKLTLALAASSSSAMAATTAAPVMAFGWEAALAAAALLLATGVTWVAMRGGSGRPESSPAPATASRPTPTVAATLAPELGGRIPLRMENQNQISLSTNLPGVRANGRLAGVSATANRSRAIIPGGVRSSALGGTGFTLGSGTGMTNGIAAGGFGGRWAGFGGGVAGGGRFGSQSAPQTFFTNYSFANSWAITNGVLSQTQSAFSSGSTPAVPTRR